LALATKDANGRCQVARQSRRPQAAGLIQYYSSQIGAGCTQHSLHNAAGSNLRTAERAMPEIELYTQPWCPYFARAISLLSAKGVTCRDIVAARQRELLRRRGGQRSGRAACCASMISGAGREQRISAIRHPTAPFDPSWTYGQPAERQMLAVCSRGLSRSVRRCCRGDWPRQPAGRVGSGRAAAHGEAEQTDSGGHQRKAAGFRNRGRGRDAGGIGIER
jgi:glutaredoxin 3